jgi:putative isomerase
MNNFYKGNKNMLKKKFNILVFAFVILLNAQSILPAGKETGQTKNKNINNSAVCDASSVAVISERNDDGNTYDKEYLHWKDYSDVIKKYIYKDFKKMCREPGGTLTYPYLTPSSEGSAYSGDLWDWDTPFVNVTLRQILLEHGSESDNKEAVKYEQGSLLNFLSHCEEDGWLPVVIQRDSDFKTMKPKNIYEENMHKPCLAQHAAFLVQMRNGDAEWLRDNFSKLQYFVENYRSHHRDAATGLYFWQTDHWIGTDNDPCTFFRPARSSGSIFLNCFMYKELKAMVYISERLKFTERASAYEKYAEELKQAVQKNCWDERDGSFYSVDLNLLPVNTQAYGFHTGSPRDYGCLIQRIDSWADFLPMWAGIATPEQAKRIVEGHYKNEKTFNSPFGIRTISKLEKMYNVRASSNPSNWQGPIWGVSNYLVWKGLVDYGFTEEAKEIAQKTVVLFGKDFTKNGTLHEYYDPDNGEPILHPGFQDWNYLVLNILAWLENRPVISGF